jgi:hypothetical protein
MSVPHGFASQIRTAARGGKASVGRGRVDGLCRDRRRGGLATYHTASQVPTASNNAPITALTWKNA